MNYSKIYNNLISTRKSRGYDKSIFDFYTETHHIIPRCLGGSDDPSNLVLLTPEEHYLAHQLLVKINPTNNKLWFSAHMMTISTNKLTRSNKSYGWVRRGASAATVKSNIKRTGYTMTEETKDKIRTKAIGRFHSQETKDKMSDSHIGSKNSMYGLCGQNHPAFGTKPWARNSTKHIYIHAHAAFDWYQSRIGKHKRHGHKSLATHLGIDPHNSLRTIISMIIGGWNPYKCKEFSEFFNSYFQDA